MAFIDAVSIMGISMYSPLKQSAESEPISSIPSTHIDIVKSAITDARPFRLYGFVKTAIGAAGPYQLDGLFVWGEYIVPQMKIVESSVELLAEKIEAFHLIEFIDSPGVQVLDDEK